MCRGDVRWGEKDKVARDPREVYGTDEDAVL